MALTFITPTVKSDLVTQSLSAIAGLDTWVTNHKTLSTGVLPYNGRTIMNQNGVAMASYNPLVGYGGNSEWGPYAATSETQILMTRGWAYAHYITKKAGSEKGLANLTLLAHSLVKNFFINNSPGEYPATATGGGIHWLVNGGAAITTPSGTIAANEKMEIDYDLTRTTPGSRRRKLRVIGGNKEWSMAGDTMYWASSAFRSMCMASDYQPDRRIRNIDYGKWDTWRVNTTNMLGMSGCPTKMAAFEYSTKSLLNGWADPNQVLAVPTWKGPYYTGYQSGHGAYFGTTNAVTNFMASAQEAYTAKLSAAGKGTIIGPFAPVMSYDGVYMVDPANNTNNWVWDGTKCPDQNIKWGAFQYRAFAAMAEVSCNLGQATLTSTYPVLLNFLRWLKGVIDADTTSRLVSTKIPNVFPPDAKPYIHYGEAHDVALALQGALFSYRFALDRRSSINGIDEMSSLSAWLIENLTRKLLNDVVTDSANEMYGCITHWKEGFFANGYHLGEIMYALAGVANLANVRNS